MQVYYSTIQKSNAYQNKAVSLNESTCADPFSELKSVRNTWYAQHHLSYLE
jgi:hypothetical protein